MGKGQRYRLRQSWKLEIGNWKFGRNEETEAGGQGSEVGMEKMEKLQRNRNGHSRFGIVFLFDFKII
jgi:hypothetical protein